MCFNFFDNFKKFDLSNEIHSRIQTNVEQLNETQSDSEQHESESEATESDDEPLLNLFPLDDGFDGNDPLSHCIVCHEIESPITNTTNQTQKWVACNECKKC